MSGDTVDNGNFFCIVIVSKGHLVGILNDLRHVLGHLRSLSILNCPHSEPALFSLLTSLWCFSTLETRQCMTFFRFEGIRH